MKDLAVIILAAGKGTRMKSEVAKVMHPVCNRPMIGFVLDLVKALKAKRAVSVLGHKHEEVRKALTPGMPFVVQKELRGTADAVKTALPSLKGFKGTVLVLYGDTPLLKPETIKKLLKYHMENSLDVTLLTAHLEKPSGYGRILRDAQGCVRGIVEEKDADDYQKGLKEVNTGIMCFNKNSLETALKLVKPNNRKKEYYLTDCIEILYKQAKLVDAVKISDFDEAMGINSRADLAKASGIMRQRINERLMGEGVTIVDPASTFISYGTKIGLDTTIYPFTVIERDVKIGKRCLIGPFAHIREESVIEDDVVAGNFLEIVRSRIGSQTFAKHFCYVADSKVSRRVNIGAGTITANFDGVNKNPTEIKEGAFLGSDTVLVAPVKIGKGAITGAGSVVLKNHNVGDHEVVAGVPAKPLKRKK